MKFSPVIAFAGLAQAAHQFTSNGVSYSVVMKENGTEVPVKMGGSLDMTSNAPSAVSAHTKRVDVQTTGNWCGLSDLSPPSGTWKSVWGGWTVPEISLRSDQTDDDEPMIVQWVGIDGDGCGTGLIQGGTVSQINSDGSQSNQAWFEFVPDALQSVSMTVNTGDIMYGNVTMTSTTSGIIEVINASTGQVIIVTITNGPGTLCGASAEWILEDLTVGSSLAPLAQFPNNSFYGVYATDSNNAIVTPKDADEVYLSIDSEIVCKAAYDSGTSNIDVYSTA